MFISTNLYKTMSANFLKQKFLKIDLGLLKLKGAYFQETMGIPSK